MNAKIRAYLLGAALALMIAAPVSADPGTTTHESTSTCATDEFTGLTSCFASETTIVTKEKHSGASDVRKTGTIHATVVDASGNLVSSFDLQIRERDVVQLASDGSTELMKVNIRLSEEFMEAGETWCTKTHAVVRGDTEKVNHVSTSPGPY
jgi:hypothetical protein